MPLARAATVWLSVAGVLSDGTEELYAHPNDPHEWHNLAADPGYVTVLEHHRSLLPTTNHPEKDDGGGLGWENVFHPDFTYP